MQDAIKPLSQSRLKAGRERANTQPVSQGIRVKASMLNLSDGHPALPSPARVLPRARTGAAPGVLPAHIGVAGVGHLRRQPVEGPPLLQGCGQGQTERCEPPDAEDGGSLGQARPPQTCPKPVNLSLHLGIRLSLMTPDITWGNFEPMPVVQGSTLDHGRGDTKTWGIACWSSLVLLRFLCDGSPVSSLHLAHLRSSSPCWFSPPSSSHLYATASSLHRLPGAPCSFASESFLCATVSLRAAL